MAGWQEHRRRGGAAIHAPDRRRRLGQWYAGRVLDGGYPTAIQRDGTPPGVLTLDIKNTEVTERYTVTGGDESAQMALGLNTPAYRAWYAENVGKPRGTAPALENPLGPSRARTWPAPLG